METNEKILVGIDPGLGGAIAIRRKYPFGYAWQFEDMPINEGGFIKRKGKGVRKMIDAKGVMDILKDVPVENAVVVIERVQAFPGVAAASAFSFGKGVGIVQAVVEVMGFDWVDVPPQSWKRAAGLLKQDKDLSRDVARKIYPDIASSIRLKKHVDRAEAALIAHFGAHIKGVEL